MYFFSIKQTNNKFLIRETSTNRVTTSWKGSFFGYVDDLFEDQDLLDGEGMLVYIYQSQLGKRKCNRGRLVEGVWILGTI